MGVAQLTRIIAGFGGVLLAAGLTGCVSQEPKVVPLTPAEKNLTAIAKAYADAEGQLGHGPADADELRPFLKEFGDPDELLKSPNDGKPFVVIWGKKLGGGPTEYKSLFPVLAYEEKGIDGQRAVTDIRGRPMTVPNEDFPKLKFIGGHKPALN